MRMFWIGLAASVVFFGIEGLNAYLPGIPKIGFAKIGLSEILNDYPWRALGGNRQLSMQPYLVSIAYLVTTEISFSIWLFALLDFCCRVLAWSMTMTTPIRDAWIGESSIHTGATHFGAIVIFVGAFLWSGRRHFRDVFEQAIARRVHDDSGELLSYRFAFRTFFCIAGVIFWCWIPGIRFGFPSSY